MENKELKEFKEILHEVKDPDRFEKIPALLHGASGAR